MMKSVFYRSILGTSSSHQRKLEQTLRAKLQIRASIPSLRSNTSNQKPVKRLTATDPIYLCFVLSAFHNQSVIMNLSLENPYGDVTIPRAKLRSAEDSTIITNPMAVGSTYSNRNSSLNPYGAFKPNGESQGPSEVTKDGDGDTSNPPRNNGQSSYTVKEDKEEEVGRSRACCLRCRRK